MKVFLIGILIITSFSASAKVCELNAALDTVNDMVKLYLEDKDQAQEPSEFLNHLMGGNPSKLNCDNLIKSIKKSGMKSVKDSISEKPLQLVHIINL
jgi:hypothetical protein